MRVSVYGWTKQPKPIPIGLFLGATADKGLQRGGHVFPAGIAVHKCNCGGVIIWLSQSVCESRARTLVSEQRENFFFNAHIIIIVIIITSPDWRTIQYMLLLLLFLGYSNSMLCCSDGPELRGHQPEIVFMDKFQALSVQWLLWLNLFETAEVRISYIFGTYKQF